MVIPVLAVQFVHDAMSFMHGGLRYEPALPKPWPQSLTGWVRSLGRQLVPSGAKVLLSSRRQIIAGMTSLPMVLGYPALARAADSLAAPPQALASETTQVVVIGGGLAGLFSALLLKRAGIKVVLLEGSSRIGGRVYTADWLENAPEFGASQIGRSYARVIDLCQQFGLRLIPEDRNLLAMASHIRGHWVNASDWPDSPVNLMLGDERKVQPALAGSQLMGRYNRLSDPMDWLDPAFADLDISLLELLQQHGHSPEALHLANLSATGNDALSASCLSMMQEQTRAKLDARFGNIELGKEQRPYGFDNVRDPNNGLALINNIEGGCSRLPAAISAELGDVIRTGKTVGAIDMTGSKAEVRCLDGTSYKAERIVCAVPFTSLRRITLDPLPQGAQAEAISFLGYAHTTRAFGTITEPYWDDGLDPSFYSDGLVKMFWALQQRPGDTHNRFMVVFTGNAANRIDQFPQADALTMIQREIERIRPSMRGKLRFSGMFGWQNVGLIGGCRHMFAPGQVTRFGKAMIEPFRQMHFAGEHTRRVEFGMEAALESGERTAIEVMEVISG